MNEMEIKQQEIINLQSQLSSSASPIGDWKVIKCYEAKMQNCMLFILITYRVITDYIIGDNPF